MCHGFVFLIYFFLLPLLDGPLLCCLSSLCWFILGFNDHMKLCNDLVCFLVTVTNLLEQNELPTATKLSARTYFDHELRKYIWIQRVDGKVGPLCFNSWKKAKASSFDNNPSIQQGNGGPGRRLTAFSAFETSGWKVERGNLWSDPNRCTLFFYS